MENIMSYKWAAYSSNNTKVLGFDDSKLKHSAINLNELTAAYKARLLAVQQPESGV